MIRALEPVIPAAQLQGWRRRGDRSAGSPPRGPSLSGRSFPWPGTGSVRAAGLLATVFLLLATGPLAAQSGTRLTGAIEVDLLHGVIEGDVCLAGLPVSGDSVTIVLNETLSVRSVSGAVSPALDVEPEPGGQTIRHTFGGVHSRPDALSGRRVADVCLRYGGVHQIYRVDEGEYRAEDGSAVIAFNGRSVRARGAARWFPTPFDRATGIAEEAIAFDLEIACDACAEVFVNGGEVGSDRPARFRSDLPRELMLVAGTFPVTRVGKSAILGESVAPDTAALFFEALSDIQAFLSEFTGVDYGGTPDIVRLDAVRRPSRGLVWGFYSDPALTLIGMNIGDFVRILSGPAVPARRAIIGFLAHELAHRYFGWSLGAGSAQRDLFGEPFATYLELKTVRHFLGEDEYLSSLRRLRERVERAPEPTPLPDSGPEDYAFSSYRYGYLPLMLFGLEEAIGESAMRRFLTALVSAPEVDRYGADFDFIRRTALAAGANEEEWLYWKDVCLGLPVRDNPCIERIGAGESRLR